MSVSNRWVLLCALTTMAFIVNVDYTAVNLALIPMAADFKANLNTIQWVLSGYVLAWAVLVIPAGKLADQYGKRNMCLIGLSLFLLASLLAGLATSTLAIVAARVLQGVAGAIYVPTMYAMIYLYFAENERGRAIGLMSLGIGLGAAVGPLIGGLFLSWANWRGIFFINIPIGLLALGVIYASHKSEPLAENQVTVNKLSVALLSISIVSLIYFLSQWPDWLNAPALYQMLIVTTVVTLGLFVFLQKKLSAPLVPLSLFANLPFVGCLIGILLEQYGFSAVIVATGIYLQKVLHFSSLESSLMYLSLTIIFGVIAAIGGPWIDRIGIRKPTVIGLLGLALGFVFFMFLSPSSSIWLITLVFLMLGAGMGLAFSGLNAGVIKTVAAEYVGVASGIFLMFALLGNSLGVALTTMIYEAKSVSKLLTVIKQGLIDVDQNQLQQLTSYIANIGAEYHDLTSFGQELQTTIINETVNALNHGINNVMLVNFLICLVAVVCCGILLRRKLFAVEIEK